MKKELLGQMERWKEEGRKEEKNEGGEEGGEGGAEENECACSLPVHHW